jgi:hypothetical protein
MQFVFITETCRLCANFIIYIFICKLSNLQIEKKFVLVTAIFSVFMDGLNHKKARYDNGQNLVPNFDSI